MLNWEHSAILSTFIKLPVVSKIFVLSLFEWSLKTGFTVHVFEYFVIFFSYGIAVSYNHTEADFPYIR